MYDNIGGKIKKLAKGIFIFEAISLVLTGFILTLTDEDLILPGVLMLFIGPLVAWVSSWILYAFGELVENSCIIAGKPVEKEKEEKTFRPFNESKEAKATQASESPSWTQGKKYCELCGAETGETTYVKIKNEYGTLYRHICRHCYESGKIDS